MTNSAKMSGAGLACSTTFHRMGAATIVDGIGVARVKIEAKHMRARFWR